MNRVVYTVSKMHKESNSEFESVTIYENYLDALSAMQGAGSNKSQDPFSIHTYIFNPLEPHKKRFQLVRVDEIATQPASKMHIN